MRIRALVVCALLAAAGATRVAAADRRGISTDAAAARQGARRAQEGCPPGQYATGGVDDASEAGERRLQLRGCAPCHEACAECTSFGTSVDGNGCACAPGAAEQGGRCEFGGECTEATNVLWFPHLGVYATRDPPPGPPPPATWWQGQPWWPLPNGGDGGHLQPCGGGEPPLLDDDIIP